MYEVEVTSGRRVRVLGRMTGYTCVVCGNTKVKDSSVTFHRIPKEVERRARWLKVFDIREEVIRRVPEFAVVTFLMEAAAKNQALL